MSQMGVRIVMGFAFDQIAVAAFFAAPSLALKRFRKKAAAAPTVRTRGFRTRMAREALRRSARDSGGPFST
jgi:hypothetical protein